MLIAKNKINKLKAINPRLIEKITTNDFTSKKDLLTYSISNLSRDIIEDNMKNDDIACIIDDTLIIVYKNPTNKAYIKDAFIMIKDLKA